MIEKKLLSGDSGVCGSSIIANPFQEERLDPIAIIGIGCRLPGGANTPDTFWKLLCDGTDAIREIPPERFNIDAFYDPAQKKPFTTVSRWGGFIDQKIDEFDADFFGISPREAAILDPLQRWLLEVSWEALEDGGQVVERLAGHPVGVFIGAFTLDYNIMNFNGSSRELVEPYTGTGTAATILSARLSYCYDFTGPCFTLDTACSSSLVAVHLACQSLRNNESSLALAGGVNAMFLPDYYVSESKAGMLAPDGRCKSFDSKANGYVRGEGAALVLLKPLSKALEDGDRIYATITGTACNQDGRSNGITVPKGQSQEKAMIEACKRARIKPHQIQYIEAHGTGTPTGDPVEAAAIGAVYGTAETEQNCLIGSVKTNIGHTEAVAGVAGLIKAALCLKNRKIPASLHFRAPNPKISFDSLGIEVVTSLQDWPETKETARAAINSFGFGGTNSHVILEEPPAEADQSSAMGNAPFLLPISAKRQKALRRLAAEYHTLLCSRKSVSTADLADLCYTAALRRSHHSHRALLVADSLEQLLERLGELGAGEDNPIKGSDLAGSGRDSGQPPVTFIFSGMGSQWLGMGHQLLEQEPLFRKNANTCDELFQKVAGWSLLKEMTASDSASRMTEYEVAQPANFLLQVCLAKLLQSWGIVPDCVVGHSAGEVAAAHIAGALSLEDSVTLIYHRSNLQQRASGQGRIVAIGITPKEMHELVDSSDHISIAAINSPRLVALSGNQESLERLVSPLRKKGVFCRFLNGTVPVHSQYMDPLKEELLESLQNLTPRKSEIPFYSTVAGKIVDGERLDAQYWWRNVRNPVVFADTITELHKAGRELFVEISPHPVLGGSVLECLQEQRSRGIVIPTLRRHTDERQQLFAALSQLYANGVDIAWQCFHPNGGKLVRTPTYPWQREVHWKESEESKNYRFYGITTTTQNPSRSDVFSAEIRQQHGAGEVHPLLGQPLSGPQPAWEMELDIARLSFLADHRLQGTIAFPGAGFVEMAWAAGQELYGGGASSLTIEFQKALFFREDQRPLLRLSLDKDEATFRIYSRFAKESSDWTLHSFGRLGQGQKLGGESRYMDLSEVRTSCCREIPVDHCYNRFHKMGLDYGPAFQGIGQIWRGPDEEALARVRIPGHVAREINTYNIHPAILDVCFQVMAAALPENEEGQDKSTVYMPVRVQEGLVYDALGDGMWIHARIQKRSATELIGNIRLCNGQGKILVDIRGCRAVTLDQGNQSGLSDNPQDFYEVDWQPMDPQKQEATEEQKGSWMLFCDTLGMGDRLAGLLRQSGEEVIQVFRGKEFVKVSSHGFAVNPVSPSDYQQLIRMVFDGTLQPCRKIVHLWSLDTADTEHLDRATLKNAETIGPISVMLLVQSLSELGCANIPGLLRLITRGAQYLLDDPPETIAIGQAPIWGMARVLGHQEHHYLWGGIIDLDPLAPIMEAETLLGLLLAPTGEEQIALRSNRTYVPRLKTSKTMTPALPARFRSDATYLITGGLGSLGLLIAEWMVEHGARNLVLMGRSELPPRELWAETDLDSSAGKRIAAVRKIESLGATCHPVAVDVEDKDKISAFLGKFDKEQRPPIRGIVHSAGVAQPKLLIRMDEEEFNRIQRPKTIGALNLHQLLINENLDFFILFSSVASVVASPGQSNYGAGNAFLDALAHYRRSMGLPALSINWGPWGEIGMATQFADLNDYFTRRGMYPMTTARGLQAFARVFGQDLPQVVILSADWAVLRENHYPPGASPPLISDLENSNAGASAAPAGMAGLAPTTAEEDSQKETPILERLQAAGSEKQQEILTSYLLDTVAKILRLSKNRRTLLRTTDPLDNLGLDSMMAIELKNQIDKNLKIDMPVVDLISGSTSAKISERILFHYLSGEAVAVSSSLALETETEDTVSVAEGV